MADTLFLYLSSHLGAIIRQTKVESCHQEHRKHDWTIFPQFAPSIIFFLFDFQIRDALQISMHGGDWVQSCHRKLTSPVSKQRGWVMWHSCGWNRRCNDARARTVGTDHVGNIPQVWEGSRCIIMQAGLCQTALIWTQRKSRIYHLFHAWVVKHLSEL